MRDVTDDTGGVVTAERAKIAAGGWGARLLVLRAEDGQRAGSTPSLDLTEEPDCQPGRQRLQASGCCASSEWIRRASGLGGRVRSCVRRASGTCTDRTTSMVRSRTRINPGAREALIAVLEDLLQFEHGNGGSPEVITARERGQAYPLDRHVLRRIAIGGIPHER